MQTLFSNPINKDILRFLQLWNDHRPKTMRDKVEMARKYRGRLLIVDDDIDFINFIKAGLETEGYFCDVTTNLDNMNSFLTRFSYDAVLLDLLFGRESSLRFIPEIIRIQPYSKILILTANSSVNAAIDAIGSGASDFIDKNGADNIIDRIKAKLTKETRNAENNKDLKSLTGIVGNSDMMQDILDRIAKLKNINSTVLILGESGSGKELIARALHSLSERKDQPFEAINCGAVPENLIESELFGHKRGAFTDAKADKKGLFEICSDGTLFLDEIGDMPLIFQVKLLRVLQEREIRPIGASKTVKINTRIIVATNRDLQAEVRNKKFREDLYYRLSVFVINIPPLRSRKEDIKDLVNYYLSKFSSQYQKSILPPSHAQMSRLEAYDWPGNIRELKHSIERAVVMADKNQLCIQDLILDGNRKSEDTSFDIGSTVYAEAKELFEKNYLQKILEMADGNISEAARISGRFRSDIYRMIKRHNLASVK